MALESVLAKVSLDESITRALNTGQVRYLYAATPAGFGMMTAVNWGDGVKGSVARTVLHRSVESAATSMLAHLRTLQVRNGDKPRCVVAVAGTYVPRPIRPGTDQMTRFVTENQITLLGGSGIPVWLCDLLARGNMSMMADQVIESAPEAPTVAAEATVAASAKVAAVKPAKVAKVGKPAKVAAPVAKVAAAASSLTATDDECDHGKPADKCRACKRAERLAAVLSDDPTYRRSPAQIASAIAESDRLQRERDALAAADA